MRSRIGPIGAAGKHGHGPAALHGAAMNSAVDTEGQPAHDYKSRRSQFGTQEPGRAKTDTAAEILDSS